MVVNQDWATAVPGLFASGEAVGGVHGANRLPGGAFGETQVSAVRAARKAVEEAKNIPFTNVDFEVAVALKKKIADIEGRAVGVKPFEVRKNIQGTMWKKVGIIRTQKELEEAEAEFDRIVAEDLPRQAVDMKGSIYNRQVLEALEVENMAVVAKVICLSAATRKESRGNHYRSDYPDLSHDWLKNIYIKVAGSRVEVKEKPVVVTKVPLEDLI